VWINDHSWDWINEYGAGLAAIAAVVTGAVAVVALVQTVRDSKERSRPYVIAELRLIPYAASTLSLVVANRGQTAARDVRVTFDRPLTAAPFTSSSLVGRIGKRYSASIAHIAPGQEFGNSIRASGARGADAGDQLPEPLTVSVSYRRSALRR